MPLRQFVRFEELFFRIVGLDEPVDPHHLQDAAHLVLFGDDEHRALVLLDVAQAVDEKADPAAVKEGRAFEVEHEMVTAFLYQPRNLIIKDFRTLRAVDIADDMDHLEFAAVFNFIFHAIASFARLMPATLIQIHRFVTKYTPLEEQVNFMEDKNTPH